MITYLDQCPACGEDNYDVITIPYIRHDDKNRTLYKVVRTISHCPICTYEWITDAHYSIF